MIDKKKLSYGGNGDKTPPAILFFIGARAAQRAPKLPLYHLPHILSRENLKKITQNKIPKFVHLADLYFLLWYAILNNVRR